MQSPRRGNIIWVSVEGLIGAGKSTFTNKVLVPSLKARYGAENVHLFDEPVDLWQNVPLEDGTTENALKRMYEDSNFVFGFQILAYTSRLTIFSNLLKMIQKEGTVQIVVSERSMWSDILFFKANHHFGRVDKLHYAIYQGIWTMWLKLLDGYCPSLILHLKTSLKESQRRVLTRSRSGEEDKVTEEYQKVIQSFHDAQFPPDKAVLHLGPNTTVETPCLHLEGDVAFKDDTLVAQNMMDQVIHALSPLVSQM